MFGMGTGVTLLLWPPGNLVSGVPPALLRSYGGQVFLCDLSSEALQARRGIAPEHFVVKEHPPAADATEYSAID